ncbi:mechanosensitive ion channel protein [Salinigranum rubrum]|uniref:Mechanosensitive ion channel protein n=1 Tax=Salinigranum rubrum TaxID=755307 RepID=A0A2I8VHT7_9EURY|nr:mechanosensitive ion channel family protein [Salinigranum rubrum]AUV81497.1 mechanosensitive ion channel protein [Salinigranum rubrum]
MSAGLALQAGSGGFIGRFLAQNGVPYAESIGGVISFIVAFIIVYIVGRAILFPILDRVFEARGLETHAIRPLKKVAGVLVVFVAIAVAFGFAGYGNFLTSLATIAAAATLAIGFAMQDVIQNFVAGVFIFTDRPFKIGDWIEWDGNSGIVEDISFRVTRVRTFDNELLTVPNSQLTDGVVKNPVAKDKLRLQIPFGIGYDDDIPRATEIIIDEADKHEGIMDDPAPTVRLTDLGDSSVVLKSRVWISEPSRADFVKTRGEYVTSVKDRFDAEDINIPYPNRTLHGALQVEGIESVATSADD